MLTRVSPNTWYEISPRGPSAKISAMAAVNGGEISGSSTTASSAREHHRGRLARTARRAKAQPSTGPAGPARGAAGIDAGIGQRREHVHLVSVEQVLHVLAERPVDELRRQLAVARALHERDALDHRRHALARKGHDHVVALLLGLHRVGHM